MFRSKRSSLVKRLLKLRVLRTNNETECENAISEDVLKSLANSLLKRLEESTLESLLNVIENKGVTNSACVMVAKEEIRLGRRTIQPHLLCCQFWRWPDLKTIDSLKQLPDCMSKTGTSSVCCNPFHWSRLILPDTPPPPYKATLLDKSTYQESSSEAVSLEVGGTPSAFQQTDGSSSSHSNPYWCSLAYWELRQRVGRLFTVREDTVNVFHELPQGSGMCLSVLQQPKCEESVARTREKIGHGLELIKEQDGVWVYNRSDFPIFVNSPTLEIPNSRTCVVKKVPPGYTLQIYNYERSELLHFTHSFDRTDGPYDPSSIRISFAKGWGPHYSRQFITSCPCWLEVLLRINR